MLRNEIAILLLYGLFVVFALPRLLPLVLYMIGSRSSAVLSPIENKYFFMIVIMMVAGFSLYVSFRRFFNNPDAK